MDRSISSLKLPHSPFNGSPLIGVDYMIICKHCLQLLPLITDSPLTKTPLIEVLLQRPPQAYPYARAYSKYSLIKFSTHFCQLLITPYSYPHKQFSLNECASLARATRVVIHFIFALGN